METYKDLIPTTSNELNITSKFTNLFGLLNTKYTKYILLILAILFIFFIICHIRVLKKVNTNVNILQTDNMDKIQDLLVQKYPTIFSDMLYEWQEIAEIFDKTIEEINSIINNIPHFTKMLKSNLNYYSLPLSLDWKFNITERGFNNTEHYFKLQEQYRYMICQITGSQRIYIASPNQSKFMNSITDDNTHSFNNIRSSIDFWKEKETNETEFKNVEYIEIILREGNILSIPNGWWYLQKVEEPCLVLECYNKSLLNFI